MCGIFGVITSTNSQYKQDFLIKSFVTLAKLSQSRGKDSSGLCLKFNNSDKINVLKGALKISDLLKENAVNQILNDTFAIQNKGKFAFGHARLVTNGTQLNDENNQPVVKDGIVAVHNGIIVNVNELWNENQNLKRNFEIDTEILLSLVRNDIQKGFSIEKSVSDSINKVFGTVSVALAFNDFNKIVLASNNGSLYALHNSKDILFFASEKYMLSEFARKSEIDSIIGKFGIFQINQNHNFLIDLEMFSIKEFKFSSNNKPLKPELPLKSIYDINIKNFAPKKQQVSVVVDINQIHHNLKAEYEKSILIYPIEKIRKLKRCTKCILPETFPFIEFDEKGECNYCRNYNTKKEPKSIERLKELVDPYKKEYGSPDILVPLSGGRDSTYALHIIKKELGLNPITFTYDWGMVTDLARRNIARICGKLGVENIIVAADLSWKRENINKNIVAWLKNPELGMIPLFMAGDKFFFYYAHKIKKQLGLELEIWGINDLENTNFKTGFAGLKPQFDKKRIYSVSLVNKLKLFTFVGKNMVKSMGYFNQSIFDSFGSFASRYFTPKSNYFHLFDYINWNEYEIENTLITQYEWEKAVDTNSTWRIGDGTASFYNYIYTLVAGFSENDTFRSNQVREGQISREKALELVYDENKPRYNSLKWYLEIIGLDFKEIIFQINNIKPIF